MPVDEGLGERQECFMDIGTTLKAGAQEPKLR
jgi:hypothetical protein